MATSAASEKLLTEQAMNDPQSVDEAASSSKCMTPDERRRRNTKLQAEKRRNALKIEKPHERQDRLRREADRKRELRDKLCAKETAQERAKRLKHAAEAEARRRHKCPRALETRKQKEARIRRAKLPAKLHNTTKECKAFIELQCQSASKSTTSSDYNVIETGLALWYRKQGRSCCLYLADQNVSSESIKRLARNKYRQPQNKVELETEIRQVRILTADDNWIGPLPGTNVTILQATNHRMECISNPYRDPKHHQACFDAHVGAVSFSESNQGLKARTELDIRMDEFWAAYHQKLSASRRRPVRSTPANWMLGL